MSVRKIIEIDEDRCDGCGLCVLDCAENAIAVLDGKARVIADRFCDGLGACLAACPRNALRVIEREAAPFDEKAAGGTNRGIGRTRPRSPSERAPSFSPSPGCSGLTTGGPVPGWPVKLRLVPPSTRCPKGILLSADCAPAAAPGFHAMLEGKTLFTACPKFEDNAALAARLADILAANPGAGIGVLRMEVPCCRGLRAVCGEALRLAGRDDLPSDRVLGRDGRLRENLL